MDFGSEFGAVQTGRAFRNPGISLCHVAFRSAALLVYLFGGMFSSSFIGVFVAVVLLLSVDFWTVKNVTGRIMVIFSNILVEYSYSNLVQVYYDTTTTTCHPSHRDICCMYVCEGQDSLVAEVARSDFRPRDRKIYL